MNFKKILVLVMTFAMLLSTFAPTLGVFAEELHNRGREKPVYLVKYALGGTNLFYDWNILRIDQVHVHQFADF